MMIIYRQTQMHLRELNYLLLLTFDFHDALPFKS
jgi:hypothetical protein